MQFDFNTEYPCISCQKKAIPISTEVIECSGCQTSQIAIEVDNKTPNECNLFVGGGNKTEPFFEENKGKDRNKNLGCDSILVKEQNGFSSFIGYFVFKVRKNDQTQRLMHGTKSPISILDQGFKPPESPSDKNNGFLIEGKLRYGTFSEECARNHGEYIVDIEFEGNILVTTMKNNSRGAQWLLSKVSDSIKALEYIEFGSSVIFQEDAEIKVKRNKHNTSVYIKLSPLKAVCAFLLSRGYFRRN
jgi:hypothetical protein